MHYTRLKDLRESREFEQDLFVEILYMYKNTYERHEQGKHKTPFYNIPSEYIPGLANTPVILRRKKIDIN